MAHFDNVKTSAGKWHSATAIAASFCLASCAVTYQFAPIEATVVDAETGVPIEGAVVTANWELVKGSLDGPRYFGQLDVKETVTDKNGRFRFEGFTKEDSSGAELRESDPQILIFKAGYEFQRFTNDYRDGGAGMKMLERSAAVNGRTVKLRSVSGANDDIGRIHTSLDIRLGFVTKVMPGKHEWEKCYWQDISRMIREIRRHELLMKKRGANLSSLYGDLIYNNDLYVSQAKVKCVSPRTLFGMDE